VPGTTARQGPVQLQGPRHCGHTSSTGTSFDEYVSELMVGRDDEAPATSRRAPSKVATPRRTRQTVGKISTSWAAASVATT
jgi:hypothetical protein